MLLLMPDLGMVGYLAGPRLGAVSYNLTHTLVAPLGLLALAALVDHSMPIALAAIWGAHIGMDRALGYGLKHESGFKDTHLGRIAPGSGNEAGKVREGRRSSLLPQSEASPGLQSTDPTS